jgi:hypothetical protein
MREIKATVAGSVLCAALLGCGSVENKSGTPIETAPVEVAKTVCPKAYDCCTAAQLMGNKDQAGTTEAECETKTTDHWTQQINAVKSSEAKGRSKYDGDKLAACLATVRSSSCEALRMTNKLTGVPGCESIVQPQVQVGDACTFDWECVQGWCKPMMSGTGDGTCAVPQEGEACVGDGHRCAPGFVCDSATTTCHGLGATGASCSANTDCQSANCDTSGSGSTGTCAPPAGTCFYASGCSVGGSGRPTLAGLLGFALLALGLIFRPRPSCRA